MNDDSERKRGSRWLRRILVLIGVIVLVLAMEGLLSFMHMVTVTGREARPVPTDHLYTDYHGQYGWVAESGVSKRDAYGPWRTLHTVGKGLRDSAGSPNGPTGESRRIACLGGTATFGVGVGDDETWCRRLGLSDADYGTVNLGQPGYGAGQTLLHYRDRAEPGHDVIVLAVDDESINQISSERHKRFAKPGFDISGGTLEISNSQVPRITYLWPWATVNRDSLAASRLLDWLMPESELKVGPDPGTAGFVLFDHIIAELKSRMDEQEGVLVLAYLPNRESMAGGGTWGSFLESEADQREMPFANVTESMRELPVSVQRGFFDSEGYLTPFAHHFIAEELAGDLAAIDELERFDTDGDRPWLARYFRDPQFLDPVGREWHSQLSLHWSTGVPHPELAAAQFGAIFDSCLSLEESESARVLLEADGLAQLSINGQTILHSGSGEEMQQRVNSVSLPAGSNHVRVRYTEEGGPASIRLVVEWDSGRATVAGPGRFIAPAVTDDRVSCGE